jgi:hypothetical protein
MSFGRRSPQVAPSPVQSPIRSPPQPHSIFARPDPNPFRHKVPAAPHGSLVPKSARLDPWNAPGTTQVPSNFFKEARKFGEASNEHGWSVPKNVKRQDELFQRPKLKYDTYGRELQDTGLEAGFNDLFSK